MLFRGARRAARPCSRSVKSSVRPQRVRPQLEELEARALLSASPATTVSTSTGAAWTGQTAQPDLTVTPMGTSPDASSGTVYYSPAQIRQAYGINQAALPNGQPATGAGETIAIVDAYNDPNIANDLAVFDAGYGLAAPPSFKVVQMNGVTQTNSSWASETTLDVEWSHAVAPGANILLVETPTNNYSDLLAGVKYAASQPGVVAVSMSWGGPEFYNEKSLDSAFTTPSGHNGVTFVASSGDNGAWSGAQWPASSPDVLAVGGTSLYLTASNNYSSESAWTYGGGGYSHYEYEPSFQRGVQTSGWRTSPDVSYDANPSTGFVVYNSLNLPSGSSGWFLEGGTSAGAPQWAGILALADQARAANGLGSLANGQADVYSLPSSDFHAITSGSNGYAATAGYNMATGLGSPIVNQVVASLATLSGTSIPASTSTHAKTNTASTKVKPADVITPLPAPAPGTPAGLAGESATAAPAHTAAEAILSPIPSGTNTLLPAVDVVETPSTAEVPLTAPPSQESLPPPASPTEAVGPMTDALFGSVGVPCWDPPVSPWSVSLAALHATGSDDEAPQLADSLFQSPDGVMPLFDVTPAEGAETADV